MTRIRMLAIVALLVVPSAALAQSAPAPMPPPPPQGGYPPPPPQGGYPPPPPQGGYAPPPQGYQPVYQQPAPPSFRQGMTFEANLGFGWLHSSESEDSSELSIAGLSLGVGAWLNERLAVTGRIASVSLSENGFRLSGIFLGPSVQYWLQEQMWVGGGAGLGILAVSGDNTDGDSITGFGLDLRAGYTLNRGTDSTFNLSVELTPGFFSENGSSATITGIGFLLGYQHL